MTLTDDDISLLVSEFKERLERLRSENKVLKYQLLQREDCFKQLHQRVDRISKIVKTLTKE